VLSFPAVVKWAAMKILLLTLCLFGTAASAEEPPKAMTKLAVILQSPDVPPGSFATKPKIMYRAGNGYCRIEEEPDPDHGIHGLTIINEPNVWMVNRFNKTAQHIVDSGPTFNCRLPIFADSSKLQEAEAKKIMELEFGHELDFFKGQGITPSKGPVMQTKETMGYTLKIGESTLALFTYGTPERPLAVSRTHGEKTDIFWYSGYGQIEFDPKLFAKPADVKIQESKP